MHTKLAALNKNVGGGGTDSAEGGQNPLAERVPSDRIRILSGGTVLRGYRIRYDTGCRLQNGLAS